MILSSPNPVSFIKIIRIYIINNSKKIIAGTINKNEKHDDFNFNEIKRMMFSRDPINKENF